MNFFVRLKFRTVKNGDDAEGILELYYESQDAAECLVQAAQLSQDLEEASITRTSDEKIIFAWEA